MSPRGIRVRVMDRTANKEIVLVNSLAFPVEDIGHFIVGFLQGEKVTLTARVSVCPCVCVYVFVRVCVSACGPHA